MKFFRAPFPLRLHLSSLDDSKAAPHEKRDFPTDVFLELTSRRIFDIKDVLGKKLSMHLSCLLQLTRDSIAPRNVCTSSNSSGSRHPCQQATLPLRCCDYHIHSGGCSSRPQVLVQEIDKVGISVG